MKVENTTELEIIAYRIYTDVVSDDEVVKIEKRICQSEFLYSIQIERNSSKCKHRITFWFATPHGVTRDQLHLWLSTYSEDFSDAGTLVIRENRVDDVDNWVSEEIKYCG